MSKRLFIAAGLAAAVAALSGCVVVPTEPAYGYGHPRPVQVVPPPVIVAPVPPPRRYWYDRYPDRYERYPEYRGYR
jgi:hypothetical protein